MTAAISVSSLHIYPLKSCAPVSLSRSWIDELGLSGDRRYLVADLQGNFLTARKYPQLMSLLATTINGGLVLQANGHASLQLRESDFPPRQVEATVWGQTFAVQHCGDAAQYWISNYLGLDCQLLYFSAHSQRPLKKAPQYQTAFADGYPLLLTNTASLQAIRALCPQPLLMEQFRPNLVITGADAFAEDHWKILKIGTLEFELFSPCVRCKMTTLPPRSQHYNPDQEPLRTLIKHHASDKGEPLFGINVIARGSGLIEVGMPVGIVS